MKKGPTCFTSNQIWNVLDVAASTSKIERQFSLNIWRSVTVHFHTKSISRASTAYFAAPATFPGENYFLGSSSSEESRWYQV